MESRAISWSGFVGLAPAVIGLAALTARAQVAAPETAPAGHPSWNFHLQNTITAQSDPAFSADYSGPNSLNKGGEVRETVSLDLFGGLRLWRGAEAHVDGLVWQGSGLSNTLGIEDFPNNEAYKAGARTPDFSFARLFVRQVIGLGGEQEDIADGPLTLAGRQDVSRLTLTVGRFSPTDVFDTNAYAGDGRSQFMNWALVTNATWDYPSNSIGQTTGLAVELNQSRWTVRYGFFQMPGVGNAWTEDDKIFTYPTMSPAGSGQFWKSWGMVSEFEYRYRLGAHAGAIRLTPWLNEAHMGNYQASLSAPGTNITLTRAYRFKYGVGLNVQQELSDTIGFFARLGWNDGQEEAWTYTDVNYSASLGLSINGQPWHRPDDTIGIAGIVSGASSAQRKFLRAGGLGILDGDGRLSYGWEKVSETYYDTKLWQTLHFTVDYQFVDDPAFNRSRGPVSVIGARLHWQF